jgi:hypothetical protein
MVKPTRKVRRWLNIGQKKYKDTNLYYKSKEELEFLDKYYGKIQLENADRIQYFFNDKKRFYYPDFYHRPLNMIIEIKSKEYYDNNIGKCLAIQQSCIDLGYKYFLIVDNDYSLFNFLNLS